MPWTGTGAARLIASAAVPTDRAVLLHRSVAGREPTVVASAPGRVNLIGEHVDYADGLVLPMAIDRRTTVALSPATDRTRITSDAYPGTWEGRLASGIAAERDPSWSWVNYVLGPLAELVERDQAAGERGVGERASGERAFGGEWTITVASDVPPGGGVSSSAALEVAVATAALALARRTMDGGELARLCQRAEHRFPGTPCGIMDMTVSANARAGHALLIDCRTLERRHVPMPAGVDVIVLDTGVRHRLADGGYASRRTAVEEAARVLGVPALRDATLEQVEGAAALDPTVRRRARHVVAEIGRTVEAASALARGDVARFGALMDASHRSLRDDFEVSVAELDCLVETAGEAGALGARMTGGGFGGCAIALTAAGAAGAVIDRCGVTFEKRFGRRPAAFVTRASDGARIDLAR